MGDLPDRDDIPDDAKAAIRRERQTHAEVEAKLRRERDAAEDLIAAAPVIFLVLDRAGRIVRFNKHLETLTGRSLVETRGEDWFSTFLPERDHVAIRRVFLQTIDNLPTSGTVNCIVTADGRDIPIRWLNRPLKDGQGDVVGVLCIGLEPSPSPGGS
jgi:PAS domain S-box-containing protein